MASPAPIQVKERIELTDVEQKIFRFLRDVVVRYELPTTLRVAGGWVRDKLLGKDCNDIDIALDKMTGKTFCEEITKFQREKGEEESKIAVIKCNPDKSKHLETAKMTIFGTDVDFVNLRSETYVESSRIPTMGFGNAEKDAYRRDFTINSLFYNINEDSVEDFTQKGLEDLKAGRIVTPLPPKATFLADPLRVLRAIRFAARFDFSLEEELREAASDSEVKAALASKISRERIGLEVDLMMSDKQPAKAMAYIRDLKIFNVVFAVPEKLSPSLDDRQCVNHIEAAWSLLQTVGHSLFNNEQRRLYLYAALFIPVRSVVYLVKKSKKATVASYIIRESLKLKGADVETVNRIHLACAKFQELILFLTTNNDLEGAKEKLGDEFREIPLSSVRRIMTGLLLCEVGDYWRISLLATTLLYHGTVDNPELHRKDLYMQVENTITELGLDGVWRTEPLLDGDEIMKVLQLKSRGPAVGKWKERVLKWQLVNPTGTEDDCRGWIQRAVAARKRAAGD